MDEQHVSSNFIRTIIQDDLANGRVQDVYTRFPPEPNGYLHIGHAKAVCLNFEIADEFGGKTNLRFDDTNPTKEEDEYVNAIQEDVRWLGFSWDKLCFASDYFATMYDKAVLLIQKGLAYVCDLTAEQIRQGRGSLTTPGVDSPYRNRTIEENLDLFARMKNGEFADGSKVLRAKIDMASPNINLRDPVLYRIAHAAHHRTGTTWSIYPMYDYAHPLEDALEGISHSLCTLEFEDHRPLYDWVIEACEMVSRPRQYEFARLNITHTIMSKRNLKQLVDEGVVESWDDPRMPTLSGLRRRGYTPESIRQFAKAIGIAKSNSTVDHQMLEYFVREDLKLKALRTMAIVRPLKVVITNWEEGRIEWLDAENNAENEALGMRKIPFGREIYIEQDDFMENPPPKYFRLTKGAEVRLKHAYFIRCEDVIKNEAGEVVELHCTYDPLTKSGSGFSARKVKGTLHFVSCEYAVPAEFRMFESLLLEESPAGSTLLEQVNPHSMEVLSGYVEPGLQHVQPYEKFQFFRHGYFSVDPKWSTNDRAVFNLVVSLKSSFQL